MRCCVVFFFSSRRRHTRCGRDWSSDVCSSDLPTASWELVHEAVHVAKHAGEPLRVGPIVSSDLFYNPDEGQYERWSKRGILAVEMEASALFTVGALRGVQAGCLLTVSDIVV